METPRGNVRTGPVVAVEPDPMPGAFELLLTIEIDGTHFRVPEADTEPVV